MSGRFIFLDDLVSLARFSCPFYQRLYQHLGPRPALSELPVTNQDEFWAAHQRDHREVLTASLESGIVLASGGSTGAPKFSYVGHDEWNANAYLSQLVFETAGLCDGDRVGNLFGVSELYASFLGTTFSLKGIKARVLQFPFTTLSPDEYIVRLMERFGIDIFAGVPSRILRLVNYIDTVGATHKAPLRRVLFAGEHFYPAQRAHVERIFPGVTFHSLGYACVDSGFIGSAEADCGPGEHRSMDEAGIMEIHDELTGEPIEEMGVTGKVIFTNLSRALMPIIRYPVGDRAQWLEPAGTPSRKFILLGRSEEAARVAHANLHVSDVRKLLDPFAERLELAGFQLVVSNENRRDRLTVRLAAKAPAEARVPIEPEIFAALDSQRPQLKGMTAAGTIHPVALEWVLPSELLSNPRTGKIRMVVDQRV